MKKLTKLFLINFFLLISITHSFAEQKLVVVDMKFILNQSKAGKEAQDFLKKSFTNNQKKFTDLEANLKKEESDLLSQKTVLTKQEYQKKADELRKKVIDYQSQRRSSLDKISTQRSKSREILLKKINPIIKTYINENNISLVIDKKYLLAGNNESDITKIVIEKLNKELPSIDLK